jgi:hypothetical protein
LTSSARGIDRARHENPAIARWFKQTNDQREWAYTGARRIEAVDD